MQEKKTKDGSDEGRPSMGLCSLLVRMHCPGMIARKCEVVMTRMAH